MSRRCLGMSAKESTLEFLDHLDDYAVRLNLVPVCYRPCHAVTTWSDKQLDETRQNGREYLFSAPATGRHTLQALDRR